MRKMRKSLARQTIAKSKMIDGASIARPLCGQHSTGSIFLHSAVEADGAVDLQSLISEPSVHMLMPHMPVRMHMHLAIGVYVAVGVDQVGRLQ